MFEFSTSTLINSVSFPGYADVPTANEGGDTIKDHPRMWVDKEDAENPILRIARDFRFAKKNVVGVFKRHWEDPKTFKVTFNLSTIKDKSDNAFTESVIEGQGTGRIELYVRLSGSNNSYYSNDFVFKGKPFYIEFPIYRGDDEAKLAKRIAAVAKKYQNMVYEFPMLKVYASKEDGTKDAAGTFVTIEGTDEYQVVRKAELQWYNPSAQTFDCCAYFGRFDLENYGAVVRQGNQGFGTYRQIVKDLRLPTAYNTRWTRLIQDETPVVGGHYTQYTIKMCVNRGIMGSDAVGEVTKSLTNHVFYVLDNGGDKATNPAAMFEDMLEQAELKDVVEVVDKDYDDSVTPMDRTTLDGSYDDPAAVKKAQEKAHGTKENDNTEKDLTPKNIDVKTGERKPANKFEEDPKDIADKPKPGKE